LSFLSTIFGGRRDRAVVRPLYDSAVRIGRDPFWYRDGAVPDTVDGRFDMLSAVLALVLIRLEAEGEAARAESVLIAETFVDDMDGTLRELGIGDVVVGKRIGKMMGALGGRTGAFRRALAGEERFDAAVRRNVFRDEPASEDAVGRLTERLRVFHERLAATPLEKLLAGELPSP
jgi:cytochrome b pre-mRNA-processing protein 3